MNIKDAFSILGLSASADQEDIKTAYRKACIKYHPDRNPAGMEMMKAVNVAYRSLNEIAYNGAEQPIDEEVNSDFGDEIMRNKCRYRLGRRQYRGMRRLGLVVRQYQGA